MRNTDRKMPKTKESDIVQIAVWFEPLHQLASVWALRPQGRTRTQGSAHSSASMSLAFSDPFFNK